MKIGITLKYCFLVSLLALWSCRTDGPSPEVQEQDGKLMIDITITNPMGTILDPSGYNFMPLPYNLGEIKNQDKSLKVIVLGPTMTTNKTSSIQLLGAIKVKEKETMSYYLIGQDLKSNSSLDLKNFDQFAVQYSSIKSIFTLYLNNQYGLGQSEVIEWRNEAIALKLIDNLNKTRSKDKTNK